jgi:hypothetical protein
MSSPASVPIPGFRPQAVVGQDLMSTVWLAADERGRTAVLAIGHRVLVGQADRGAFLACAATPSRVAASPSIADVLAHAILRIGGHTLQSKPGPARRRIPWLRGPSPPVRLKRTVLPSARR